MGLAIPTELSQCEGTLAACLKRGMSSEGREFDGQAGWLTSKKKGLRSRLSQRHGMVEMNPLNSDPADTRANGEKKTWSKIPCNGR